MRSGCPSAIPPTTARDLGRTKERHYPDPEHQIDEWAKSVLAQTCRRQDAGRAHRDDDGIKEQFKYAARDEVGVQAPLDTLAKLGSGSCRDFAVFMMEAARSLGLAARFVSGYLYDENLVGAGGRRRGRAARPTRGCRCFCRARAGWSSTRPMR